MPVQPLLCSAAFVDEIVAMHNQQLQLAQTPSPGRGRSSSRSSAPVTCRQSSTAQSRSSPCLTPERSSGTRSFRSPEFRPLINCELEERVPRLTHEPEGARAPGADQGRKDEQSRQ